MYSDFISVKNLKSFKKNTLKGKTGLVCQTVATPAGVDHSLTCSIFLFKFFKYTSVTKMSRSAYANASVTFDPKPV